MNALRMKNFKPNLPLTIFTNTFYQGLGRVIVTSLGLISTIILTRYLGVIGFGQLNLIFVYLGIAATVADFGLTTIAAREEAREKLKDSFVNTLFTLRVIVSIITLLIFVLLSFFLYSQHLVLGIMIYAFGSFFILLYNIIFSFFQARLEMYKHMIAQISGSFLTLLITVFFVYLKLPFLWIVGAQVVGNITIFMVGLRLWGGKVSLGIHGKFFKKIIKNAWPIFVSSIIAAFYWRLDMVILSFFKNPNILPDVGIYSTAYRVFEVFVIFGTFFTNALFPLFVKKLNDRNLSSIFTESILLSLGIGVVSAVAILFLAKYMILVVGGQDFLAAILPLRILSVAFALSLFINIFYSIIVAYNLQKYTVPVSMVALIFNASANIIFIPHYSYMASSVITGMTSLIILIGYILITKKTHLL